MSASDRQVAGSHYKAEYQHWDYCVESQVPNLEYASSKYLTRWRKKNGLQDLQKSTHYLEKRIECAKKGIGSLTGAICDSEKFSEFCESNGIHKEERLIIYLVMHWTVIADLEIALIRLNDLIDEEQGQADYALARSREGA